jgi:hypothetical protein
LSTRPGVPRRERAALWTRWLRRPKASRYRRQKGDRPDLPPVAREDGGDSHGLGGRLLRTHPVSAGSNGGRPARHHRTVAGPQLSTAYRLTAVASQTRPLGAPPPAGLPFTVPGQAISADPSARERPAAVAAVRAPPASPPAAPTRPPPMLPSHIPDGRRFP